MLKCPLHFKVVILKLPLNTNPLTFLVIRVGYNYLLSFLLIHISLETIASSIVNGLIFLWMPIAMLFLPESKATQLS